ncbi:MAG: cytochrome P450 [Polyangiaceae bacterium]
MLFSKAVATIPHVRGFPLNQLLEFRRNIPAWQMKVMNEYGDICGARLGIFPCVLLSSPELAQSVLVDQAHHFMKSRGLQALKPVLGEGLLTSEHEFHRRQRKLISPGFQHRRIGTYAGTMASYTEAAQALWKEGEMLDASEAMMRLTLAIAGKTMFNADLEKEARDVGEAVTIANRSAIELISSVFPFQLPWPTERSRRSQKALDLLDRTVYRMISDRRASGEDPGDVLSMLLAAEEEGSGTKMTDTEVRDETMTLFLAGHETTAVALAWALHLLSRHPDVYARLQREVDTVLAGRSPTLEDMPRLPYAMQVFKETMRLYPPAYIVGRMAMRDVMLGSHRIPKGITVFVNIYGMHHRAKFFSHPDRFDPDRFRPEAEKDMVRSSYLPFGGGPRVCIGNQFALLEGQIVLATLAQRITFEPGSTREIQTEPLITLRPKNGVPLIVRRRPVHRSEPVHPGVWRPATPGQA